MRAFELSLILRALLFLQHLLRQQGNAVEIGVRWMHDINNNSLLVFPNPYILFKAVGYTKTTFPDENYAREFMQLFSIGLLNVNPDGSPKVNADNKHIPTYNNDHIMASARVWTGMTRGHTRDNRERPYDNAIDPMVIKYDWHDFLPKANLNGGHLADGYPLCADHPRAFLAQGWG